MALIEYLGASGVGKTHAALQFLARHSDSRPGRRSLAKLTVPAYPRFGSRISTYLHALTAVFEGARHTSVRSAWCFFRSLDRGGLKQRLYWTLAYTKLLLQTRYYVRDSRTWVLDQGIQQLVLSCVQRELLSTEAGGALMSQFLGEFPGPAYSVICLSTARERLAEQVRSSAKHREAPGEDEAVGKALSQAERLQQLLTLIDCAEWGNLTMISLDTSDS